MSIPELIRRKEEIRSFIMKLSREQQDYLRQECVKLPQGFTVDDMRRVVLRMHFGELYEYLPEGVLPI